MFTEFQVACFGMAEYIVGTFIYWYWFEKQKEKKYLEKQERKERAKRRVLIRNMYESR